MCVYVHVRTAMNEYRKQKNGKCTGSFRESKADEEKDESQIFEGVGKWCNWSLKILDEKCKNEMYFTFTSFEGFLFYIIKVTICWGLSECQIF